MTGQKGGFAELLCLPCHPSGLIPFPFGFSTCPPCYNGFLFFLFFSFENNFNRELRILTKGRLSKQRLVLIVIDFLNQFSELLKMVFDNVVQIRINR